MVADLDCGLRSQIDVIEATLRANEPADNSAAAAAAVAVPLVCSEDVAVLKALEEGGREFSNKAKGQLGEVVSRHFKLDVGAFYEMGIGERIREFRAVSAETSQQALSDFVSGANNGDDLRLCLKAGADVNGFVNGQTALMKAVSMKNREAAQMILSDGADINAKQVSGDTALTAACRKPQWEMVGFLVEEGADVDVVVEFENVKALQIACKAAEKQLDTRALKDLVTKTSELADLKISAREDFVAESLVHFFCWHEFEELLLLSLSWGVDIDAVDVDGSTALMIAAARSKPHYVKLLIENGADIHKEDEFGDNALLYALPEGDDLPPDPQEQSFISSPRTILDILLDRGVDINFRGSIGKTALHLAVDWGVTEIVRFLVERGADLQVRNESGQTPHDLAVARSRSPEMVALLVPPLVAAG
uniref:Uncharacterized protein n=1 Tax=Chromera velia CCMP2878 TaxID=1169474 RepID=A0A0G4ICG8_9ALVE|eukprot:Cvel_13023.t1-p1 / transcript=Cvel_13023.t1 / gene=Cvel_13023 / organism=Chromera_velia_CCMP2878 / gene_product=Putative ankyrin repeat protein RF_0381, putative / transcript_product=Putative ankyrin repeat protein RF_0381, putative / location=Cvel_scaffold874:33705-35051(+) / protein_length=420 / sequence_SO=supercontig / SO=protein_coding / is_pseudo=false